MDQLYKHEVHPKDSKNEILLQKDLPPDYFEDYDLIVLISELIEKIRFTYSNGQINHPFFQEIQDLKIKVEKNKSQFLPVLIKSEIIQILFAIYQNEKLSEFKLPVLFCLSDLSTLGFHICNIFLQENFIQIFKDHFSFEDNTSNSHLIQIYYNILHSIYHQNIIDKILKILSLREFFSLTKKIEDNPDIICNMFLCLNELMKHTIDDINDENVIYEIIYYYFYEKELFNSEVVILQNAFARNSLSIIKNRLYFSSFNYELFERYHLFEFLDYYLQHPPIENFSIACDVISLLIAKYQCDYQFDFNTMIEKFEISNSEKNQFSAINSIDSMIQVNPSLSIHFFQDQCSLFFEFVHSFSELNSKTKESLFQLIFDLLKNADSQIWTLIFDTLNKENQEQANLFSITSEIMDYGDYQFQKPIIMLENIFKWASELNYLDLCYKKFNDYFEEKSNFDFDDEKTQIFFQTYFSTEK